MYTQLCQFIGLSLSILVFSVTLEGQSPALIEAKEKIRTAENDSLKAAAYLEVASMFLQSEPDSAHAYIDKASRLASYMAYPAAEFHLDYWTARAFYNQRMIEESTEHIKNAINGFTELGDDVMKMKGLYFLGRIYSSKSDYSEANKAFLESMQIAEIVNDSTFLANSLNALGVGHRRMGDREKALEYYNRSLDLAQAQGNQRGITVAYINKGIIEKNRKNFEKSLGFYEEAERSYEKEKVQTDIGLSMIYRAVYDLWKYVVSLFKNGTI